MGCSSTVPDDGSSGKTQESRGRHPPLVPPEGRRIASLIFPLSVWFPKERAKEELLLLDAWRGNERCCMVLNSSIKLAKDPLDHNEIQRAKWLLCSFGFDCGYGFCKTSIGKRRAAAKAIGSMVDRWPFLT